jgi:DNA replication and repair protein RecF
VVQERRARYRVSRGQQKLLAATLVIAQIRFVAAQGCKDMVLLVDDPAAELDPENRQRLFDLLQDMPAQMFITALDPKDLPWRKQGMMFHVDQGKLSSSL